MQASSFHAVPVIGIAGGEDSGSMGGMMEHVPRPLIARAGAPSHVAVGGTDRWHRGDGKEIEAVM